MRRRKVSEPFRTGPNAYATFVRPWAWAGEPKVSDMLMAQFEVASPMDRCQDHF